MNLLSSLQQNEKFDGKWHFFCGYWSSIYFFDRELKTLFLGSEPGISSEVRNMESDKVVSINLVYDFKHCKWGSSHSGSFNILLDITKNAISFF